MNNPAKQLVEILNTIVEMIQAKGELGLPEGELYANLMPLGCGLAQFRTIVSVLVDSGKVRKRGHLLLAG